LNRLKITFVMARYRLIAASLTMFLGQLLLRLRCGYATCSCEVNDFTVFFQEVEFTFPVVTHDEYIDIMLLDVFDLLAPVVLRDDFVYILDRFKDRFSVFI